MIFTGKGYSDSRGELYNDDPRLGDARLCGTTASLSGLEATVRGKCRQDRQAIAVISASWIPAGTGGSGSVQR
ncbi:MAG: hypothetical protein ACLTDF_08700 [Coprococcus sp.]